VRVESIHGTKPGLGCPLEGVVIDRAIKCGRRPIAEMRMRVHNPVEKVEGSVARAQPDIEAVGHTPRGDPGTMDVHNVKLPTGHHIVDVKPESTEIDIPNALNDPLVDEHVPAKDLRSVVLACPNTRIVQKRSFGAGYKAV